MFDVNDAAAVVVVVVVTTIVCIDNERRVGVVIL